MTEALTKATHSAEFLVGDLQAALTKANNVEALIVLDLITERPGGRQAKIKRGVLR